MRVLMGLEFAKMQVPIADLSISAAMATVGGVIAGASTMVSNDTVAQLVVGFAGALLGGAVVWGATRERLRVLVEGQSALWEELGNLRAGQLSHLRDWHNNH